MDIEGQNFMVDHCSAFYTTDESISCNETAANLTIQYCNCSQGQNYNSHAFGHLLQAGSNDKLSFLNNMDAHQTTRCPRVGSEVGTGAWNDFRNNVIYNWLPYAGYTVSNQPSFNNFIQNFYIVGPGGDTSTTNTSLGGSIIFYGADPALCRVFADGNRKNTTRNGDLSTDLPTTISTTNSALYDYIRSDSFAGRFGCRYRPDSLCPAGADQRLALCRRPLVGTCLRFPPQQHQRHHHHRRTHHSRNLHRRRADHGLGR
jgi:hypothetical protein